MNGDPARRGPRPRAACPWCGRSTAVTFGTPGSGHYLLRPHNHALHPWRCRGSSRRVSRDLVAW